MLLVRFCRKNVFAICDYVWTHFYCCDVVLFSILSEMRSLCYFWLLPLLSSLLSDDAVVVGKYTLNNHRRIVFFDYVCLNLYHVLSYILFQSLTCSPRNAYPFDCSLPDTLSPIYRKIAYCPRDFCHFK